jgi:hypothetical protein
MLKFILEFIGFLFVLTSLFISILFIAVMI